VWGFFSGVLAVALGFVVWVLSAGGGEVCFCRNRGGGGFVEGGS